MTSTSSTVAGSARSPASSTATRILLRRRPGGRVRAPRRRRGLRGASCAGGGILSTVRATRAAGRRASPRPWSATASGCSRRHDDVRGEVGLRLDRETELARSGDPRCGRRPDLARRACGPARVPDADAYLDFALPSAARGGASSPRRRTSSSSAAPSTPIQARRYLEACRDAGLALRLHGDQFTEAGAIPLAIELGARSVDHLEATGPGRRSPRSPRAT